MQAQYSLAVSRRYHLVITPPVRTTFFPQAGVHAIAVAYQCRPSYVGFTSLSMVKQHLLRFLKLLSPLQIQKTFLPTVKQ
jgi:hypothetical protein